MTGTPACSTMLASRSTISRSDSRPRSGKPMLRAIPPPVAYAARNPERATSRADSPSHTPGATITSPPRSNSRSRVDAFIAGEIRAATTQARRLRTSPTTADDGDHAERDDGQEREAGRLRNDTDVGRQPRQCQTGADGADQRRGPGAEVDREQLRGAPGVRRQRGEREAADARDVEADQVGRIEAQPRPDRAEHPTVW